jgi:hypothetical protein
MPDYQADYPDVIEPAYIRFDSEGSGEFAFIARPWPICSTAC